MTSPRVLSDPKIVVALGHRLSTCDQVTRNDEGDHKEAWELAYGLADLEESFERIMSTWLPKLIRSDATDDELVDALHDIGEEFRHILYHIKASRYYDYLHESSDLA